MAQSLRQIKSRIRSIESVKKITRAMEMVSVSKVRPLQKKLSHSREYASKLERILFNALAGFNDIGHPLLEERADKKKIALCLMASDTGLCGSYNHNVIRSAEEFISQKSQYAVTLIPIGNKGFSHFKKSGLDIYNLYATTSSQYPKKESGKITKYLMDIFTSKRVDEVYVAYTYFESASRHIPRVEKILNIMSSPGQEIEYIAEPQPEIIFERLLPFYVSTKINFFMLNSALSEHSARAIAMGEATDNAKELFDELILLRNKVRQANITKDIMEIISSADALKG